MARVARRLATVFCAVVALTFVFDTGIANAKDPLVGRTYADAASRVQGWGGTPAVSTVVGSHLPTDQCIVTSWYKKVDKIRDHFDHDTKFMISLNCNARVAQPGKPGNSLATPEGRLGKQIEDRAARYNRKPELCDGNDSCKQFCEIYTGKCSKEVMAYFK